MVEKSSPIIVITLLICYSAIMFFGGYALNQQQTLDECNLKCNQYIQEKYQENISIGGQNANYLYKDPQGRFNGT